MFSTSIIVSIVFGLSILCIIGVIFVDRKNPASTLAWVLILTFLPGVGFIAYIFLGSGFRINKKKEYALKEAVDALEYERFLMRVSLDPTKHQKESFYDARLVHYLHGKSGGMYTADNEVSIFTDGNSLFEQMKEDMRKAQHHIHLSYYIFRNDRLGKEVMQILEKKAQEGVVIRVIYDSVGSLFTSGRMFLGLQRAGGQVAAFFPVFSTKFSSHIRLNYRNHRKITVIDGVIGYIGGMNIGDEYLGEDPKLSPWRDTQLRIVGSAVWFLQERFIIDWAYISQIATDNFELAHFFPAPKESGKLGVQIVSSGPDLGSENPIKGGMQEIIYKAMERVYIQTPYFAPDDNFFEALQIAARSGVDVRLMIPRLSDNVVVHWATLSYAKQALFAGVRIFLYDGFLHAKTIVSDSKITSVGSTNISNRSFYLNFEVNAFIHSHTFAQQNEAIFLEDQTRCVELTSEWFEKQNMLQRSAYSIARLLGPLI